jgi:hypothetical protein
VGETESDAYNFNGCVKLKVGETESDGCMMREG